MSLDIIWLLAALALILISAELFTNGIEWLGQMLDLGEGMVGSVMAAVGTAMPETLIPFIAIIFFGHAHGHDIGIGAIVGAPFMLSTLTLGLFGIAVAIFARAKVRSADLNLNQEVVSRDLAYFMSAYCLAVVASFLSAIPILRWCIAATVLLMYPLYIYRTLNDQSPRGQAPELFHLDRIFKTGMKLPFILVQSLLGVAGIVGGAYIFVEHIQTLSQALGLAPIYVSLIVCPIATELPEKINSILWAKEGKDTLAMGNITGALVFQTCIPVAFAIAFTSWNLSPQTMYTAITAIASAAVYWYLLKHKRLNSFALICGVAVYALTVAVIVSTGALRQ